MVQATITVDDFDGVVAAYERLGFSRVKAWSGAGRGRSALFRAGPSRVEVRERALPPPRPLQRPVPPRQRASLGTRAPAEGRELVRG